MNKLLSLIVIGFIVFAISCKNNSTNSTVNPSINGNWLSTVIVSNNSGTITLVLNDSAELVRGTAKIIVPRLSVNDSNVEVMGSYLYPSLTLNLPMVSGTYNGTMASDGESFSGTLNASLIGITNINAVFNKQ